MPEDGSLSDAGTKPAKKPNWSRKLFSKDKSNKSTADEQVDDFLGTSRAKPPQSQVQPQSQPQSQSQPQPNLLQRQPTKAAKATKYSQPQNLDDFFQRPSIPTSPRVDVSVSRHPDPHNPSSASPQSPSDVLQFHGNSLSPQKKKPRRPGLRVTFKSGPAEEIGEGGEEAEASTQEISLYRMNSLAPTLPNLTPTLPNLEALHGSSSHAYNRDASNPPSDRYTEPGARSGQFTDGPADERESNYEAWNPPLIQNQNPQDAEFLYTMGMDSNSKRLSLRGSGDSNSFAKRIQARMRAEEGLALQKGVEEPSSPAVAGSSELQRQQDLLPLNPTASSSSLSLAPEVAEPNISHQSLRAIPTPVTYEQNRSGRLETNLPSPLGTSGSTPPPPYLGRTPSAEPPDARSQHPSMRDRPDSSDSGPKKSLRSMASAVGDSALADFAAHVNQYNTLFELAAERVKPMMETSLSEWVRASMWWFLKGRAVLEENTRSRSSNGGSVRRPAQPERSTQAVVDLAKAWWINKEIVPQHPELARHGSMSTDGLLAVAQAAGDDRLATLIGLHQGIISNLRALSISMKRNGILPSAEERTALDQALDTTIWVRYPFFTADVITVLSGTGTSMLVDAPATVIDTSEMMPMGDTTRFFNYGRMFVDVYLSSSDDDSQEYAIPCVMSIIRDRSAWHVIGAIASQNELVNVKIENISDDNKQTKKKKSPSWNDVEWHVKSFAMQVRLNRGFELDVQFKEADFRMIWNIIKYTQKTEESLNPQEGEMPVFENIMKVFQYMDPGTPKAFPAEPTTRCRVRLFEKTVIITEGTGTRIAHRGFRIAIVTSPKVKTLSSINHTLGGSSPIVFGYLRGENGSPALLLKVKADGRRRSMLMTFHDLEERTRLHSLLLGVVASPDEIELPDIPMQSFSIEEPETNAGTNRAVTHLKFTSPSASVINTDPNNLEHGYGPTVLSENLRVFVNCDWGSVTDRVNLGPGELKLSLDLNFQTSISVYRPPQQDLTISVAENLVDKDLPKTLTEFLDSASKRPTIRNYTFKSLSGLHQFQAALTGFRVLFDGFASTFAISRRRMVVPIYKKWETNGARIQIIQHEKTVQLMAFFSDFSHGKCMNFALKSTDTFESFSRPGKFQIKIVDAKFALPKSGDNETGGFVCLDMPDYPGEHDDITLTFDSDKDRRTFESVVPGTVKEASRMGSLRK